MRYERFQPTPKLQNIVREFWIYENDDKTVTEQKVIPDGYSEIIIHYGDPYEINLSGSWQKQSRLLFSSQISKYFFLKNTGKSSMLGIKLHPSAFYSLFKSDMSSTVDQVLDLDKMLTVDMEKLDPAERKEQDFSNRINLAESWLTDQMTGFQSQAKIDLCLNQIFETKGLIDIDELSQSIQLSTRQLERTFKKVVGVTPKFYCRIIRFNYIFEVIKEHNDSWIRTALQSGYFDQSHFIKNFKEFTGEEPSNYGFDEQNLSNFFLNK